MRAKPMVISLDIKFPHAHPVRIESDHAPEGLVDTKLLFERYGISLLIEVTHEIQDRGNLSAQVLRFVEQRGRVESRYDLIAKLAYLISFPRRNTFQVLKFGWQINPLL